MTEGPKQHSELADDPIVADLRAQRDSIAAGVDYDLDALVARLSALERAEREKGRVFVQSAGGKPGAAA